MTTLDKFLNTIPQDIQMYSSHQQTPTHLYMSITEKEFVRLINFLSPEHITFQFLEKKVSNEFLIHLIVKLDRVNIQVSFNIIHHSHEFGEQLLAFFPSAAIYLQNIEI